MTKILVMLILKMLVKNVNILETESNKNYFDDVIIETVEATKDYMDKYSMIYTSDGNGYCININSDLVDNNYLTDKEISNLGNQEYVKITYEGTEKKYEIVESCEEENISRLVLNGESDVIVELNGTYIDEGVTATSEDNIDITSEVITKIYDKDGKEIGRVGAEQRELVYYDDLPELIEITKKQSFFYPNSVMMI